MKIKGVYPCSTRALRHCSSLRCDSVGGGFLALRALHGNCQARRLYWRVWLGTRQCLQQRACVRLCCVRVVAAAGAGGVCSLPLKGELIHCCRSSEECLPNRWIVRRR